MQRIFALSQSDRWLLLEAGVCLGLMRAAVLTLPFRWLTRGLRQQIGDLSVADDPTTRAQRQRVAWAIRVVSRRTFWNSNCLAQALAGKVMLRRREIASTLYLGVAKGVQTNLEAHAWLRSGNMILTGDGHLARYTVIATFVDADAKR